MTDITKILTQEDFQNYISALENNQNYSFEGNGLKIDLKFDGECESLYYSYQKPKTEKEEFTEFLNNLDNDLFVDVCERSDIKQIDKLLKSDDIESVRSAIIKFKSILTDVCNEYIEYYTNILEQCK